MTPATRAAPNSPGYFRPLCLRPDAAFCTGSCSRAANALNKAGSCKRGTRSDCPLSDKRASYALPSSIWFFSSAGIPVIASACLTGSKRYREGRAGGPHILACRPQPSLRALSAKKPVITIIPSVNVSAMVKTRVVILECTCPNRLEHAFHRVQQTKVILVPDQAIYSLTKN